LSPSPLAFQRLLDRLKSLGAALVLELDSKVLMVYERDEGYFGLPRGKRYPLVVRPNDQAVPLLEIETCLAHIGFSANAFWSIDDGYLDSRSHVVIPIPENPIQVGILQPVPVDCCPACNSPMPENHCAKCATVH